MYLYLIYYCNFIFDLVSNFTFLLFVYMINLLSNHYIVFFYITMTILLY